MISQDEFAALAAQGHNRIPVVREVLSDLDTPLSVYLKLADGPYTYLLESVEGGETWGRHSIIGLPCRKVYKLHGHRLTVEEFGVAVEQRELADVVSVLHAAELALAGHDHGFALEDHEERVAGLSFAHEVRARG